MHGPIYMKCPGRGKRRDRHGAPLPSCLHLLSGSPWLKHFPSEYLNHWVKVFFPPFNRKSRIPTQNPRWRILEDEAWGAPAWDLAHMQGKLPFPYSPDSPCDPLQDSDPDDDVPCPPESGTRPSRRHLLLPHLAPTATGGMLGYLFSHARQYFSCFSALARFVPSSWECLPLPST